MVWLAASATAVIVLGSVAGNCLGIDSLPEGAIADSLLLEKGARRLTLYGTDTVLKSYTVSLGREPVGAKQFQGDGRTPEGHFVIDWRNSKSDYHLALHLSYPRVQDRKFARSHGRSAGGAIMIHGIRNGLGFLGPLHRLYDWTEGCIALTDAEIEEVWRVVPDGTPIDIRP